MKDLFLTYAESQKILRVLINSLFSLIIANALSCCFGSFVSFIFTRLNSISSFAASATVPNF